jgi:hypothetical protein
VGVVLTLPVSVSELAASMRKSVDWKSLNQTEAQDMSNRILQSARMVAMMAPQHLAPVQVKSR